jgi:N-acetylmuramoyl-L-alanine amidase
MAALLAVMAGSVAAAQTSPAAQRFVVVLDAAHGGDDAGAHLGNQPEKAYTLALSVRLRSLLTARGFAVVTTRESDEAIEPDRRAEIANHAAPQACLSLHASLSGSGVHLFVSSLAPVEPKPFVPWKTAQAAWVSKSLTLAGTLDSALSHATVPVTLGRTALPAVESMTCPAVAVEIAPNRSSGAQGPSGFDDPQYQTRVVEALAAALVEWRAEQKGERQP